MLGFLSRTTLKPLLVLTALCLLVREQYPFSNFPMYSSFSRSTRYVYLADGSGQPLATVKATGITTPTLKKIYESNTRVERERLKKLQRRITAEDKRAVGERVLQQVKARAAVRQSETPLPDVLRLYEVTIRLARGRVDRETVLVAEL